MCHGTECIDGTVPGAEVVLILYETYLHLLHHSPPPFDLLPLTILYLGGIAYPDFLSASQCLPPPGLVPGFRLRVLEAGHIWAQQRRNVFTASQL